MTVLEGYSISVLRYLAVLCAAAVTMALLPLAGVAVAQQPDLSDACPVEPGQAPFTDRDDIPDAHVRNVDCAEDFGIVTGFVDNSYGPRLPVRRDQMASFIARGLDAAGVNLPSGDENRFTDVTTGPHRVNVNRLAEADIVRGGAQNLPATQYGAGLQTRRDQMASFLMRAAGYALEDNPDAFEDDFSDDADQVFTDVPPGNTHFGNVNAASEFGLAQGFVDGLYRPGQSTRRDQMASFVVRLLNFLAVPTEVEITDQTPETATVGETITVTAMVFDQYGNPAAETTTVTFSVDPPTAAETQTVTTDANSEAEFSFTPVVPETVTVTASIEGPGGNFTAQGDSDSVEIAVVLADDDGDDLNGLLNGLLPVDILAADVDQTVATALASGGAPGRRR